MLHLWQLKGRKDYVSLVRKPILFAIGVFLVIAYAGIVTILPDFMESARPVKGTKPYSVLELAGRHVYIKDSCNACEFTVDSSF